MQKTASDPYTWADNCDNWQASPDSNPCLVPLIKCMPMFLCRVRKQGVNDKLLSLNAQSVDLTAADRRTAK